ncbi:MAG: outer membrane beta-barrel protein [Pseudomonadota bacterium]|nr:outer membrane beta-barrel protein [Pseudomonadota bacterium]
MKPTLIAIASTLSMSALAIPAQAASTPTGFYAGATLGFQSTDMDWKTDRTLAPDGTPIAPFSDTSEALSDSDASYGIFTGYNWMLGQGTWVLGAEFSAVESDASDDIRNRIPGLGDPNSNPTSYSEVDTDGPALGLSIRGGYLLQPNAMVYTSVGLSQLEVETTSTCPADTNVCNPADGFQRFSDDERMTGWTLGFGGEYFLSDNLMLRAEYRYADYGDFDFTAIPAQNGSSFGADATIDVVRQTVELGAAYKF